MLVKNSFANGYYLYIASRFFINDWKNRRRGKNGFNALFYLRI